MEANKAPEKIYIDANEDWHRTYTAFTEKAKGNDIEYTRTDAFIEKACFWLKSHYRDYMYNPTGKRLEAFFGGDMCNVFEDYMKGE